MGLLEILLLGMFVCLILGLLTGHPLAFVMGGISVLIGYYALGNAALHVIMIRVYDSMNNYNMVAIPMFVLMANFLTSSKIADGLFESIRYLLGGVKGGLGLAVVLVSVVFATTTGIVGAAVVTMGMLAIPVLLKNGYKPELAVGMVVGGGCLGILLPPSIMLVTMGSFANVSVGRLFIATIIPGLLLALLYATYVFIVCQLKPDWGPAMSKEELAEIPMKKRITGALINLVPPIILVTGVLGSIFTGMATPTEASGVGAFVALVMAIFYRQFSFHMLYTSLINTLKTTSMVFILLFGANAFTGIFLFMGGTQVIINMVQELGFGNWGVFFLMALIVFILGLFLDWLGVVMLAFPIFLPLMDYYGFDRLWVVVVMAVLLQTCFMTPPFGLAIFYVRNIVPPEITMDRMFKGATPFVFIVIFVVVLLAIFPQLATWLPSVLSI